MFRRAFLATSAAFLAAGTALAGGGTRAYTPGLVNKELKDGNTVFIDFYTDWCTTCRSQRRTIEALKATNPAYADNIVFVNVDWDQYSNSKLARKLNIPRRSTLVVLSGNKELGRIVAGTGKSQIKALLDTALAAAVA